MRPDAGLLVRVLATDISGPLMSIHAGTWATERTHRWSDVFPENTDGPRPCAPEIQLPAVNTWCRSPVEAY